MKKTIAFLLSLALCVSLLALGSTPLVHGESLYIRKIVSVVYDDSGSMMDDSKWPYANYAMQTFCGMLNSEDQLYLSYMSDATIDPDFSPVPIDLSSAHIQQSVNYIRNHTNYGQTPYTTVQTAFQKLLDTPDDNPNTQYWLVILTDGGFNDGIIHDPFHSDELTENFEEYVSTPMPNGSNARVTYFAIGNDATRVPAQEEKGIHTFSCSKDSEIIDTMSQIADKISGRTRLEDGDITMKNDRTVQFSSSISLLNIAVLAQKTDARIVSCTYSNEVPIPISRQADLNYTKFDKRQYPDLNSCAYLLGDSENVIGAGTYKLEFNKPINKDDIVILYEPALEVRMKVFLNDQELTDLSDLSQAAEGDTISVTCDLYEMNTDHRVDPSLLPKNTVYHLSVLENDTVTEHQSGTNPQLSNYPLKNVETKLKASVEIENFNPIELIKRFTPSVYAPPDNYEMKASFDNDVKSIHFDDLPSNRELKLRFTVSVNGEVIRDPSVIRGMNPRVTLQPEGNDGETVIEDDGTITFTPNKGKLEVNGTGSFDVAVKCTVGSGKTSASATETYSVRISDYQVISNGADGSVCKTEFYNNKKGVSFTVTKDGAKLPKELVEQGVNVSLNDQYRHLETDITVDADGTIHIIPYSTEQRDYHFGTWWGNWWYYFSLPHGDVEVTLSHAYGTGKEVISVTPPDAGYIIWWVIAPLLTELLLLFLITAYIVRYVTKPRFVPNGALYVGSISRSRGNNNTHSMDLHMVSLRQYNRFVNLWNPFRELTVNVEGIRITAVRGNRIRCEEPFPWYSATIIPQQRAIRVEHPADIVNYCMEHSSLIVREIRPINVLEEQDPVIEQDSTVYYCINADMGQAKGGQGHMQVILDSSIICYSTAEKD